MKGAGMGLSETRACRIHSAGRYCHCESSVVFPKKWQL